jgi:cysteine desulfurase
MQIYLDSSATTAPRSEVIQFLQKILTNNWGNPSSLHFAGERATTILETARWQVASLINAVNPQSIIFTSGGTEADNLAIFGVAEQYDRPQNIIISSVEHSAIAKAVAKLGEKGWQITKLPVNHQGRVNPQDLQDSLQANTVLVSIIYGQSEVGTIQPISELVSITKQHSKALFHTDAVQVVGHLPVDVQNLGVDLLSLSGHKFHGIQGAGALYLKEDISLQSLLRGGQQESGLRAGTQALPAIASLGLASQLAQQELGERLAQLTTLRNYLIEKMESRLPWLILTGDRDNRLPQHTSFLINHSNPNLTGRKMVRELNLANIAIGAGSACNSGNSSPSPTLLAMGYSEIEAIKGIRLSLDCQISKEDLEWTVMVMEQIGERFTI